LTNSSKDDIDILAYKSASKDEENKSSADGCAEYYPYVSLGSTKKTKEFDAIFRVIQGKRHNYTKRGGTDTWLRFVFRRWFIINEFINQKEIDGFWIFDSDTLLFGELGSREQRFSSFDATTQCMGQCLNGWVGSAKLVSRYTDSILDQFNDSIYLILSHRNFVVFTF
jgi:hypothetical protein